MSLLKKIHKKIYQKNSDIEDRKLDGDVYDPTEEVLDSKNNTLENIKKNLSSSLSEEARLENPEDKMESFVRKNKRVLILGLSIFSFIFILIGGFLIFAKYRESLFDPERILISFQGPEQVESGSTVKYKLKIKSDNRAKLSEAEIRLDFSKELKIQESPYLSNIQFGSAIINVGTIDSLSEKEYEYEFDVFGAKDSQGYIDASLSYKPENSNSKFENKGQIGFTIKSSALDLTLIPTREAASGEMVEIQAVIENQGDKVFENVALVFSYPTGFSFMESQPEVNEKNNYWLIGDIQPGAQEKITIKGSLTGEVNAIKNFSAELGQTQGQNKFLAFTNSEGLIKIAATRMQLVNILSGIKPLKAVKAGDVISTTLKFKNTSSEPLRDLVLIENLSSPVIDKASLSVKNGFYDSVNEKIIWKASQISQLKVLNPQQEGQVEFNFKIKENFPMESSVDKNFTLNIQPEIESLDIDSPLGQNKKVMGDKLIVKVASKLVLDVTGSYDNEEISNSGPYPPQIGEKSTFTIKLSLRNTSNDLKNAVLFLGLPSGITWENKFLPDNQRVEFNERTNELIWKLGTISSGTGFISPVRKLIFQIGVIPSENQIDPSPAIMELISGIKVNAEDAFTEEVTEYSFNKFSVGQLSDY